MTSDRDFNNQMNTVIAKRFAPDEDVNTKKQYEKMMNLAIIVCIWCLSCVGIYTYWYKYVSNLEYNKLVMDKNTRELDLQMQRYLKASDAYVAIANKGGDLENTGEVKIRRTLYNEMIRTIELFEKCNYIRSMNMGSEYPYAEVIIACVLLSIVCGIVIMSNIVNNPSDQLGVNKRIAKLRMEIQNMGELSSESPIKEDFQDSAFIERYQKALRSEMDTLNSRGAALSQDEFRRLNDITMELRKMKETSGGGGKSTIDSSRRLDLIRMKTNRLSTELNFLKSDSTFNQGIMTVVICVMTFYISLTMLNSSASYTKSLYSGKLFADSRCV